jgi:hypothetical protein
MSWWFCHHLLQAIQDLLQALIMIASKSNAQEVSNSLSSKSRESFEPT